MVSPWIPGWCGYLLEGSNNTERNSILGKAAGAAQGGTLNCPRHLEVTVAADDDAKRGTIAVRCRVREILA
jgi:hypothetical protein